LGAGCGGRSASEVGIPRMRFAKVARSRTAHGRWGEAARGRPDGSTFGALEPAIPGRLASGSRSQKNVKAQHVRWFQPITIELSRLKFELCALTRKLFSTRPPALREPMGFPTKTRC